MPVFPLVASTMVLPTVSFPVARPARIMLNAGRSFTEPPGLNHSAFAKNLMLGNSLPTRSSLRSGVFPMRSSTDCPTAMRVAGNSTFVDARSVVAISLDVSRDAGRTHMRPKYSELDATAHRLDILQQSTPKTDPPVKFLSFANG